MRVDTLRVLAEIASSIADPSLSLILAAHEACIESRPARPMHLAFATSAALLEYMCRLNTFETGKYSTPCPSKVRTEMDLTTCVRTLQMMRTWPSSSSSCI